MILCFNIHSALLLLMLFIAMVRPVLYSGALQNKKHADFAKFASDHTFLKGRGEKRENSEFTVIKVKISRG